MTDLKPDSGLDAGRHLRIWWEALRQAVSREAQFRTHALVTLIVSVIQAGVTILPTLLIFHYTSAVNGWDAGMVTATVGLSQLVLSLLAAFVAPNLTRISRYVKRGELDLILLRPVSAQFFTTFRWIQPAELFGAVIGLGIVVIGLATSGAHVTAAMVPIAILWFAIGFAAVTCLWANLSYLSLWFQSADPIADLMVDLLATGRYPMPLFPRAVQGLMVSVIPIGVATTLPVQVLTGRLGVAWLLVALVATPVVLALTRWHWTVALRRYESASS